LAGLQGRLARKRYTELWHMRAIYTHANELQRYEGTTTPPEFANKGEFTLF